MNVTVFGGSQPNPGEPAYIEAQRLGQILGAAGHTILTGGYIGTMEAVSEGAASVGAHVVGVTCEDIEAWRRQGPNQWVIEERRCKSLPERIMAMINGCDAAIALPGGPGTLTEISLTWNLLLTDSIRPRPLILIGEGWRAVFEALFTQMDAYIPASQRKWLLFAPNIEAVGTLLSTPSPAQP